MSDEKPSMETRSADAKQFKAQAETRLKEWDARIDGLKEQADGSAKPQQREMTAAVRDLESHRDRTKDELARVSEKDNEGKNETAQSTIDRHFQQMDQVYNSKRADAGGAKTVTQ
jgi:hypothetical protein